MRILSLSAVLTGKEEGAPAPFSFIDFPSICEKCTTRLAQFQGYCSFCFIEDEPDFDLIFRDHR